VQLRPVQLSAGEVGLADRRVGAPGSGGDRADRSVDEQLLIADEEHQLRQRLG
jgi:hypothetical protein